MTARPPEVPPRSWSAPAAGSNVAVVAIGALAVSALVVLAIRSGDAQFSIATHWFIVGGFSVAGVAGWSIVVVRPLWVPARVSTAAAILVVASLLASLASSRSGLSMPATWDLCTKCGTALLFCASARWSLGRRALVAAGALVLALVIESYLIDVARYWLEWLQLGMPLLPLPLRPAAVGGIAFIPTWMADDTLVLAPLVTVAAARRYGRVVATVVVVAAVACVVISGTRSLWLLAAPIPVFLAIRWIRSRGGAKVAGAMASAVVLSLLLAVALGLASRVLSNLDEGRTSALSTALSMFARSPLLGTGPASYPAERLSEQIPVFAHYAFPNAHNIVLTTAGETGLVGLVAMLAAVVLLGGQLLRTWRAATTDRPVFIAAIAGAGIVLGHAMVDVVVENPGILLLLFLVGALALVAPPVEAAEWEQPRSRRSIDNPRLSRVGGLVAFAVLLAVGPRTLDVQQSIASRDAAQSAAATDPRLALELAQRAVDRQPDSASAVDQVMVLADAIGDSQAAIAAARRLVELEGLAQHQVELAVLLDRAGQHDAALSSVRAALSRDAVDPFVQLNGAVLLAQAGDGGAAEALARLIVAQPFIGLQAAAFPPAVRGLLPIATSTAIPRLQAAGRWSDALAAALAGDPVLADAVLVAAPADQRDWLTQVRDAWRGDVVALAALEASLSASPANATDLKWAWLLDARRCANQAATRWARVLAILDGEDVGVPVELGAGPQPTSMRPLYYPTVLYPVQAPAVPYVTGTWTYDLGLPACSAT